ncbi:MAG: LysR family transcriptional regulator [Coxiellaceae bacterium]|nr:LysR family transcriptional regulator [Coxiellaceae bacterium]
MSDTLNLNLLKAFQALYEEQNVTRAGKRLCITQSAMSNALTQLRKYFDDTLFIRERYGMRPTPKSNDIFAKLQPILAQIDEVINSVETFNTAESTRKFTIGSTDIMNCVILPKLVEKVRKLAPNVDLVIKDCDPLNYDQSILDQRNIELCIGTSGKLPTTVCSKPLLTASAIVVGKHDHPMMKGKLTLDKYLEAEHMIINVTGYSFSSFADVALQESNKFRKIPLRIPYVSIASRILPKTEYLATIPELLLTAFKNPDKLSIQPCPVKIPDAALLIAWHNRFDNDPGHLWLRNLILETAAELIASNPHLN